MTRTGRASALLAAMAIGLAGCQTTGDQQPSGAVAGGMMGAASGAGAVTGTAIAGGGFSGQNILIGAVVGAIVGHYVFNPTSSASFSDDYSKLADEAAMKIVTDPTHRIVHWESKASSRVFGWAEPATDGLVKVDKGCRVVRSVRFVNGLADDKNRQFCRDGDNWVESEARGSGG